MLLEQLAWYWWWWSATPIFKDMNFLIPLDLDDRDYLMKCSWLTVSIPTQLNVVVVKEKLCYFAIDEEMGQLHLHLHEWYTPKLSSYHLPCVVKLVNIHEFSELLTLMLKWRQVFFFDTRKIIWILVITLKNQMSEARVPTLRRRSQYSCNVTSIFSQILCKQFNMQK